MSYETVTLDSIVRSVLRKNGEDPDSASTADNLALLDMIADRFELAWQYWRWPVLLEIGQRRYRDAWTATSYAEDAEVWHEATEAYYVALTAATGSDVPGTATSVWEELADFNRYVAYEQTGETAIRACLRAWDEDPRATTDAGEISFEMTVDGVRFAPDEVDGPWLEIQARAPEFHAEEYSAAATYAVDDRFYWTDGEVYKVVTATTAGQTPGTHAVKFTALTIPRFLAKAIKAGAYADWLANDEQHAKSASREPRFEELLDEEVWQFTKLQGQTGTITFPAATGTSALR